MITSEDPRPLPAGGCAADRSRLHHVTARAARNALRRAPTVIPAGGRRSLQVLETAGDLETLRAEWDTLQVDFAGPSNHLDWWVAFALAPPTGTRPLVLVLRDDDRLVGIAPLSRRRGPLGTIELINSDDASGFHYADALSLHRLMDAVLGLRRPLALRTLVRGSATETVLHRRARLVRHVLLPRSRAMGPSLVVDDRFAEPVTWFRGKKRSELRRRSRRLDERGAVSFHMDPVGDDLATRFAEFVRIESSGWKGRRGTSLEHDVSQRDRLFHVVAAPAVRDRVRFASMRLDGAPIAVNLVIVDEQRLWTVKDGYDEAFSRFEPGTLLRLHLMSWAASEGLERIEFMGVMDKWKRSWGEGLALRAIRSYPVTPRGLLGLGVDAATQMRTVVGSRLGAARSALARRRPRSSSATRRLGVRWPRR